MSNDKAITLDIFSTDFTSDDLDQYVAQQAFLRAPAPIPGYEPVNSGVVERFGGVAWFCKGNSGLKLISNR